MGLSLPNGNVSCMRKNVAIFNVDGHCPPKLDSTPGLWSINHFLACWKLARKTRLQKTMQWAFQCVDWSMQYLYNFYKSTKLIWLWQNPPNCETCQNPPNCETCTDSRLINIVNWSKCLFFHPLHYILVHQHGLMCLSLSIIAPSKKNMILNFAEIAATETDIRLTYPLHSDIHGEIWIKPTSFSPSPVASNFPWYIFTWLHCWLSFLIEITSLHCYRRRMKLHVNAHCTGSCTTKSSDFVYRSTYPS